MHHNILKPDEVLAKIRRVYLARLKLWVDSYRTRADVDVWLEPAWRDDDLKPARHGPLLVPKRVDVALLNNATSKMSTMMFEHEARAPFEPMEGRYGNGSRSMEIRIGTFGWDDCTLTLPRSSIRGISESNWAPLRHWYETWFDLQGEDGTVKSADWSFRGVCHFLSDPEEVEKSVTFGIDFGSAPVDAVLALLDRCHECGVSRVTLGTGGRGDDGSPAAK